MQKICVRFDLKGELAEKFEYIKERLGCKTDISVLVHLINDAYEKRGRMSASEEGRC